jgi:hypothetical protein
MSSITINGDTSGSVILAAPAIAGSTTLTLPSTSGTVLTTANTFGAGTGPAFSAYGTALNSVSNNTWTKISFNTKEFDTNSNYDNVTNYRFTPTVAGYYQVNACIAGPASSAAVITINIYKNGSAFKSGAETSNAATYGAYVPVSALIYCNGSTDYLEIYVWQITGGTVNAGSNSQVFAFSAFLARSA